MDARGTEVFSPIEALAAQIGLRVPEGVEPSGVPGKMQMIGIADLMVDGRYQRLIGSTGRKTVRQIVEHFDWTKFAPLLAAPADGVVGKYAVVDGQHRAVAAALLGIETVPVYVHDIGLMGQARVFRDVNAVVTAMSALHLHFAGVQAGAAEAIGVDAVARAAGVEVKRFNLAANKMKPHETISVKAIARALKRDGFEAVKLALEGLRRANVDSVGTLVTASQLNVLSPAIALAQRTGAAVEAGTVVVVLGEIDPAGLRETLREQMGTGYMVSRAAFDKAVRRVADALVAKAGKR